MKIKKLLLIPLMLLIASCSIDNLTTSSVHEHVYDKYNIYSNYHEAVCTICSYTLKEDCEMKELEYDPFTFKTVSKCEKCGREENTYKETSKLIFEFSVENENDVLTIYSDEENYINSRKINDSNIIGTQIPYDQIEEVVIGDNIVNVEYIPEFYNMKKITFSSDVKRIGEYLIYSSSSIKEIVFEGDAPVIKDTSLVANGASFTKVKIKDGAKGFDDFFFGGYVIENYIPSKNDISNLTMDKYAYDTAKESGILSKKLVEKAKKENREYMLYYPIENNISNYKEIREFTIKLTKDLTSEDEKIKKIYDYICHNIAYVEEEYNNSPYQVFKENKAVCAGYVSLMHDMLAAINIPSFYSRGITRESC